MHTIQSALRHRIALVTTLLPCALQAHNPLQIGHNFYGADPSVVIADDGRLFLFPTTDNRDWEKQFGWSCYSTTDLVTWENHGVVFSNEDSKWGTHKAWAPDITKKDGGWPYTRRTAGAPT